MDKYFKYSELTNPTDTLQIDQPFDIKSRGLINGNSSPKEMANFVVKKLSEFIEQELKTNTTLATEPTMVNPA